MIDQSADSARFDQATRRLERLGCLVQAQREARHAESVDELFFHMVNNTHQVVGYRQAALWSVEGHGRIVAVSGLPETEPDAPYIVWLTKVFRRIDHAWERPATRIEAVDLPENLRDAWSEWLPARGIALPLTDPTGQRLGMLFLAQRDALDDDNEYLLAQLADSYGHAWSALLNRRSFMRRAARHAAGRLTAWLVVAAAVGLMFVPIRQSVLAPAEVVAADPSMVRARMDGVVSVIHVAPNEPVRKDQLILELDPTDWQNRMRVTELSLEVARAEYRLAAQRAVFDNKSKARVVVLKGKMEAHAAKLKRVHDQLRQLQVHAARDGVAIYANPSDWIGRPVVAGEKIMQIADLAKVELEIMLPISDAINLEPGAETVFFLNIDPQTPLGARVRSSSFRATETTEGFLAFRLKAEFADRESPPRIGLRGTAKVFGDDISMFFFLFRRPLAKARQWLGL